MTPSLLLVAALLAAPADTTVADSTATVVATLAPVARPAGIAVPQPPVARSDTTRPRRRAVEVSDAYATRLAIHRYASYTMLPLFAAQYVLGDRLLDQKGDLYAGRRTTPVDDGLRTTHTGVAIGVATLFTVNTVTGLWNLYESRKITEGRGRRTLHTVLMLASDAGFVATGVMGSRANDRGIDEARQHRNVALASMVPAVAGAAIMWFRRD